MSEPVQVTRMELLKLRAKKKLAQKGHSLLKKKRDALIKEFFGLIKEYKKLKEQTLLEIQSAFDILHVAQGVSGVNRVKGLALSSKPSFEIGISTKNLMGVHVPKFTFTSLDAKVNASLLGTSYHVEESRKAFVHLLPMMIKLAEIEQVIFTLAQEIKKTKRRVNALEFIKIPEMSDQEKYIKMQLAEVEREAFSRLKNVKKKLQEQDN